MRILFIGDIVGKPARNYLANHLQKIISKNEIDLVIANGENAAGGAGITEKVYAELIDMGIDLITGGNHTWDRKDIYNILEREEGLIRPANLPTNTTPGRGAAVLIKENVKIGVINLIGRVFMNPADCPFRAAEREIKNLKKETNLIIVDFHAEATSEKQAMGWYLDGKVSAVLGTHSHVQTADCRILNRGTAFISDVGMVGKYDSILGVDIEGALQRFITRLPHKLEISEGKVLFNAVIIDLDIGSGKALEIKPISEIF
ncbi:MAG: TIGR00282 family metallophosphoesterase [Bacillota bacterium]|nr:TIGR00282 family metallophosphoesterase [Bacillota bacterium]